jgi:hypothetical protein
MRTRKKLISTKSTNSSRWEQVPSTLARHQRRLSMMANATLWYSRFGAAETKVYWRSPDGNETRTTTIPGKGIQTFQTAGEFKLQAVGEPNHEVNYGYVLLGLRDH